MIRTSVPREWPAFTRRASISSLLDDPNLSAKRSRRYDNKGTWLIVGGRHWRVQFGSAQVRSVCEFEKVC
jgi:hypothetical protein